MISTRCDISDFVEAIENKDYLDIIYLADQEATAAERLYFKNGVDVNEKHKCSRDYASALKNLISFLRYGVRPSGLEEQQAQLFNELRRKTVTEHHII